MLSLERDRINHLLKHIPNIFITIRYLNYDWQGKNGQHVGNNQSHSKWTGTKQQSQGTRSQINELQTSGVVMISRLTSNQLTGCGALLVVATCFFLQKLV